MPTLSDVNKIGHSSWSVKQITSWLPQQTVLSGGILGAWLTWKQPGQTSGSPHHAGLTAWLPKPFHTGTSNIKHYKTCLPPKASNLNFSTNLGFKNTNKPRFGVCLPVSSIRTGISLSVALQFQLTQGHGWLAYFFFFNQNTLIT